MAQQQQTITTGVWKISCGDFWLRDVNGHIELSPIEGEQGDHLSKWRLNYNDSQRGNAYVITNVETGINAWAEPPNKRLVQAGDSIKWLITSAGNGLQHIQWPNDNYYWTAEELAPGPVVTVLEGLRGLPTQVWKFTWVGDF